MPHVVGENRNQLFMLSLEEEVPQNAFVRLIDVFVNAIDLESFGFAHVQCKEEGRPAFHPSVLMKLYLYGYRYGIRTSRKLEREAGLNLEAMWLTSCQYPKYKTIADFRKIHGKAFREVFRRFVKLLRDWELVDGKTIAIDSFKIRAQNSLKNNLNQAKIDRHLEYIDNKVTEYETLLDQCDQEEDHQELQAEIALQKQRKEGYTQLKAQLVQSGEEQISLTDPDARSVVLHRNIVNVGYNVQAAVDSKHKLLVGYQTGDVNDTHALSSMAIATKELLNLETMDVLADKGYHTGIEISKCETENIKTYVSPKAPATKDTGLYPVTLFVYNNHNNTYTCPAGETLKTKNIWHRHSGQGKNAPYRFRRYTTNGCKTCPLRSKCTNGKQNGRAIDRSEYADAVEQNNQRVIANPNYYRQRQQLAEHPFGTLKRQRGFTFALVKSKEKVLGEVGLEFIGYNLTRCANLMGMEKLIKALIKCCLLVSSMKIRAILSHFEHLFFINSEMETDFILKIAVACKAKNQKGTLYLTKIFL